MVSVVVTVLACSVVRHVAFLTLLAKIDEELASPTAGKNYRVAFSLTFLPDLLGTLFAIGIHAKKSPLARYAAPVGAFFFSASVATFFLIVKFRGGAAFWAFVFAEMWIRLFHQVSDFMYRQTFFRVVAKLSKIHKFIRRGYFLVSRYRTKKSVEILRFGGV
jgi:hypothetical protein